MTIMVDSDDDGSAEPADRTGPHLSRIAAILGCSFESLMDETWLPSDIRDTCELLRLWSKIDRPAARARVLEYARQVSGSSQAEMAAS